MSTKEPSHKETCVVVQEGGSSVEFYPTVYRHGRRRRERTRKTSRKIVIDWGISSCLGARPARGAQVVAYSGRVDMIIISFLDRVG